MDQGRSRHESPGGLPMIRTHVLAALAPVALALAAASCSSDDAAAPTGAGGAAGADAGAGAATPDASQSDGAAEANSDAAPDVSDGSSSDGEAGSIVRPPGDASVTATSQTFTFESVATWRGNAKG